MKSRLKNKKIPVMVRRTKDKSLLEVIDVPCAEIGMLRYTGYTSWRSQTHPALYFWVQRVTYSEYRLDWGVHETLFLELTSLLALTMFTFTAMRDENSDKLRPNFRYEDSDPGRVRIITEGTCKAVYGVEQVSFVAL